MEEGAQTLPNEVPENNDLLSISKEVLRLAEAGDVDKAEQKLSSLSRAERRQSISSCDIHALFIAVQGGHLDMVKYLLDECDADIEQKGYFKSTIFQRILYVPPVWLATYLGHEKIVRSLVSHGACMSATAETYSIPHELAMSATVAGSTPLYIACYFKYPQITKFLIENGADINPRNLFRTTCLLDSWEDQALCYYLIDKGADVAAADTEGNTPLLLASRVGHINCVKIFLDHESDAWGQNKYGDDALRMAALRGHQELVDILIERLQPNVSRQIECYELLGCASLMRRYITGVGEPEEGLDYWNRALQLREHHGLPMQGRRVSHPVFTSSTEISTIRELHEFVTNQPDLREALCFQTLFLIENILGSTHPDAVKAILRVAHCYKEKQIRMKTAIDLLTYCFRTTHHEHKCCQSSVSYPCIATLAAISGLYYQVLNPEADREGNVIPQEYTVQFEDIMTSFNLVIEEVKQMERYLVRPMARRASNDLRDLYRIVLNYVSMVSTLPDLDDDQYRLLTRKVKVILVSCRDINGQSLLHVAMDADTYSYSLFQFVYEPPNCDLMEVLLDSGADPNSKDWDGNTLLHLCSDTWDKLQGQTNNTDFTSKMDQLYKTIKVLLKYGAYLDAKNKDGVLASETLSKVGVNIDFIAHVTLQSLSAKVIKGHQMGYHNVLPQSLVDLVDLH